MLMMLFIRIQQNLLMLMMLFTCFHTKAADANDAFCLGSLVFAFVVRPEGRRFCLLARDLGGRDYSFAVSPLRKTACLRGWSKKFMRSERR